MKKNIALFALAFNLIALISCQKDSDETLVPDNSSRVKTYTTSVTTANGGGGSRTYNISYDDQRRVIAITPEDASGYTRIVSYPSTRLYSTDTYDSGRVVAHSDYYLNAALLVDSIKSYRLYTNKKDSTTLDYTYNSNNQLTTMDQYDHYLYSGRELTFSTNYTYGTDGNLATEEVSRRNVQLSLYKYEYYPDLSYPPPFNIGPITLASTKKRNLLKKFTISNSGSVSLIADYTYTFDSKDRIVTEKSVHQNGNIYTTTYTYF